MDGRTFYIDHTTKRTQWEDPRLNNPEVAGQVSLVRFTSACKNPSSARKCTQFDVRSLPIVARGMVELWVC